MAGYGVEMPGGSVAHFDQTASDLAEQLDRTGFVCLENVVAPPCLAEARYYVQSSCATTAKPPLRDGSCRATLHGGACARPERAASSHAFHFDAAVVTMLVPLFIPTAGPGRSGQLVVLPNRRRFRRSAVIDLVEEISTQNPLYRNRTMPRVYGSPDDYLVEMKPGNVYLFWIPDISRESAVCTRYRPRHRVASLRQSPCG